MSRCHHLGQCQVSRVRTDHQLWLNDLETAELANPAMPSSTPARQGEGAAGDDSIRAETQAQPRHEASADGTTTATSSPQAPWPEPDFYRIHVVAQDGAPVGSGVDSDGSAPIHTLEYGSIVVAYERCVRYLKLIEMMSVPTDIT